MLVLTTQNNENAPIRPIDLVCKESGKRIRLEAYKANNGSIRISFDDAEHNFEIVKHEPKRYYKN